MLADFCVTAYARHTFSLNSTCNATSGRCYGRGTDAWAADEEDMFICAAGDIHGAKDRLYDDVLTFEASLGVRFDYVLHVGDFGTWPDPNRVDKAARMHDGAGDFPAWFAENRAAPRPTVFIKGNHEASSGWMSSSRPVGA